MGGAAAALDPTTMGWKQRGFYLGEHAQRIFDANGNAGPTAWWAGRIVGGWTQAADGSVIVVPAEGLARPARQALAVEADRLTTWLDGDVVRSIYQSPLVRTIDTARRSEPNTTGDDYASILSMPVGRPPLDDLLGGIDYWTANEYPARGEA